MQQYLSAWLPVWLDVWTEVEQWDLVAELLIVDACLPQLVCPTNAWQQLAIIQRPDGLLPRDTDPVHDGPEKAYKAHHPTLVAAIVGTLGLSRTLENNITPPDDPPPSVVQTVRGPSGRHLAKFLLARGERVVDVPGLGNTGAAARAC